MNEKIKDFNEQEINHTLLHKQSLFTSLRNIISGVTTLFRTLSTSLLNYYYAILPTFSNLVYNVNLLCDLDVMKNPSRWYWKWKETEAKKTQLESDIKSTTATIATAEARIKEIQENLPTLYANKIVEDRNYTYWYSTWQRECYTRPGGVFNRSSEYYDSFMADYPDININRVVWCGDVYNSSALYGIIANYYIYKDDFYTFNYELSDAWPNFSWTGTTYGKYYTLDEVKAWSIDEQRAYFNTLNTINEWIAHKMNGIWYDPDGEEQEEEDEHPLEGFISSYDNWLKELDEYSDELDLLNSTLDNAYNRLSQLQLELANVTIDYDEAYQKWLELRENCREYIWGYFPGDSTVGNYDWNTGSKWVNSPEFRNGDIPSIISLERTTIYCYNNSTFSRYDTSDESDYFVPSTFIPYVARGIDIMGDLENGKYFYRDSQGLQPIEKGTYISDYTLNLTPYGGKLSYSFKATSEMPSSSDIPTDIYPNARNKLFSITGMPETNTAYFDDNENGLDYENWKNDHIIGEDEYGDPIYDDPTKYGYRAYTLFKFSFLNVAESPNKKYNLPSYYAEEHLDWNDYKHYYNTSHFTAE